MSRKKSYIVVSDLWSITAVAENKIAWTFHNFGGNLIKDGSLLQEEILRFCYVDHEYMINSENIGGKKKKPG